MTRIYYVGARIGSCSQQMLEGICGMTGDHITIAYSRVWFPYAPKVDNYPLVLEPPYEYVRFGELLVLAVRDKKLRDRHREFRDNGASWDFPSYIPHITLFKTTEPEAMPDFPITLTNEFYGTWGVK